ncbi:hypothetical protein BESB_026370 [Besnoitia besnoiti]|uniref:Uncharacterized protein n=1 Tax=Besnoitia besnoiti TaxID=94643 RepID=A0A2A9M7L3_BESBE|nr:uncharacterized protein BESB_026370 [Besnoitia besnoiti]PFH31663.1 hypothetical protein BESB_026370 [Besnoitia besnoiti]
MPATPGRRNVGAFSAFCEGRERWAAGRSGRVSELRVMRSGVRDASEDAEQSRHRPNGEIRRVDVVSHRAESRLPGDVERTLHCGSCIQEGSALLQRVPSDCCSQATRASTSSCLSRRRSRPPPSGARKLIAAFAKGTHAPPDKSASDEREDAVAVEELPFGIEGLAAASSWRDSRWRLLISPRPCRELETAAGTHCEPASPHSSSCSKAMASGRSAGAPCCDSSAGGQPSNEESRRQPELPPVATGTTSSFFAASDSQSPVQNNFSDLEQTTWERGEKSSFPIAAPKQPAEREGLVSGNGAHGGPSATPPGGDGLGARTAGTASVLRGEQKTLAEKPEERSGFRSTSKHETAGDVQEELCLSRQPGRCHRQTSLCHLRATQSDREDEASSNEKGIEGPDLPRSCGDSPVVAAMQQAQSGALQAISSRSKPSSWLDGSESSKPTPPGRRHTVGAGSSSCWEKARSQVSFECVDGGCLRLRHCWSCRSALNDANRARRHAALCRSCHNRRELARWKQMTDWRASVEGIQFLSLQKHYKYQLPNQLDSAAFSVHNKIEKRLFFVVTHTTEPRASHLPAGWHMSLYLPNPSIQHDVLNVTDPKSTEAFTVIRADRPCGHSLLSYVSRPPVTVKELVHCRESKTTKRKVLGYITMSRSPFTVLRVRDAQRHKLFDLVRHRKGNKERLLPQEWVAYGASKSQAMAEVTLFLDECKSIAGRDATFVTSGSKESRVDASTAQMMSLAAALGVDGSPVDLYGMKWVATVGGVLLDGTWTECAQQGGQGPTQCVNVGLCLIRRPPGKGRLTHCTQLRCECGLLEDEKRLRRGVEEERIAGGVVELDAGVH